MASRLLDSSPTCSLEQTRLAILRYDFLCNSAMGAGSESHTRIALLHLGMDLLLALLTALVTASLYCRNANKVHTSPHLTSSSSLESRPFTKAKQTTSSTFLHLLDCHFFPFSPSFAKTQSFCLCKVEPVGDAKTMARREFQWQLTLGIVMEIGLTLLASVFSVAEAIFDLLGLHIAGRWGINPVLIAITTLNVLCNAVQVPLGCPVKRLSLSRRDIADTE